MRLFLAIELPIKIKSKLSKQLKEIKKDYPQFNWIPEENYHLTLHFFGDVVSLPKLIDRLKEELYDKESFYLYSTNCGVFINKKIILYLGFRKEKKLLIIEDIIGNKKNFIPHLTFARCRIPSKQQYYVLKKKIEKLKINIEFPVKELTLFESLPNGKYPIYKKIAHFPLI